jgi:hypothetical protein
MAKVRGDISPRPGTDPASLKGKTVILLTSKAKELDCHVSALQRAGREGNAIRSGLPGPQRRVFLKIFKALGRWYTTEEDWQDYLLALNGDASFEEQSSPQARTVTQRRRQSEAAGKLAEQLGA